LRCAVYSIFLDIDGGRKTQKTPSALPHSTKVLPAAVLSLDFDEAIDFSSTHRFSFSRWAGGRYITAFSSLNACLDFHAWWVGRGLGGLQRSIDGWEDGWGDKLNTLGGDTWKGMCMMHGKGV
jgi:hypothetical protein